MDSSFSRIKMVRQIHFLLFLGDTLDIDIFILVIRHMCLCYILTNLIINIYAAQRQSRTYLWSLPGSPGPTVAVYLVVDFLSDWARQSRNYRQAHQ